MTGSSPIKHVVVLMLENRSFDSILGWLYDKDNKPPRDQPFEGLDGVPPSVEWQGALYGAIHTSDTAEPAPDPNEPYANMYRQMFNPAFKVGRKVPDAKGKPAPMNGFMQDYQTAKGVVPDFEGVSKVMSCFYPADLPYMNALAAEFAVCDHWYASVPSQTFTNRSFVHAGTASGHVNNVGNFLWWKFIPWFNGTPTMFNRLHHKHHKIRLYYGGLPFLSNAWIFQDRLHDIPNFTLEHCRALKDFVEDAKTAKESEYPSYVFVEPIFLSGFWGAQNDGHPEALRKQQHQGGTILQRADRLVRDVYNALRSNEELWRSTMLVVTFDEFGGTYDHVSPDPQEAPPPDRRWPCWLSPFYSGFKFDRYGGRVPAIVCSPYTERGTVSNDAYDHTSILRTAADLFLGGKDELGKRTAGARNLLSLLNLDTARDDALLLPDLNEDAGPFEWELLADVELSEMQKALVIGAKARARKQGHPAYAAIAAHPVRTHRDAWEIVAQLEPADARG